MKYKTPFFGQYGDRITVQNVGDLKQKFSVIDCAVPPRTKGRKSDHRERYCLRLYLMESSRQNKLCFPLDIAKSESPDFIMYNSGQMTALEVTDAGEEGFQEALALLEKCPDGTVLECGTNQLVRPGERLTGEGWDGNAMEVEWAKLISEVVFKKTKKLNDPHFQKADSYELLIYDNSHLGPGIDAEEAISLLGNTPICKEDTGCIRRFDVVSVILDETLRRDIVH